jgi:hypothetical protein
VADGASAGRASPEDVLLLTDASPTSYAALSLPFVHASIIEVDALSAAELPDQSRTFDAVVVDRSAVDLAWLEAVAGWLRAAVRPGGRVIVVLSRQSVPADAPVEAPMLSGFAWGALEQIGGWPCAVLHPTMRGASTCGSTAESTVESTVESAGVILAAADAAVRLALAEATASNDRKREMLAGHVEARRRSDLAMLAQMEELVGSLEAVVRQYEGFAVVKTVLRRSRGGRLLLRLARAIRRTAQATVTRFGRRRPTDRPAAAPGKR